MSMVNLLSNLPPVIETPQDVMQLAVNALLFISLLEIVMSFNGESMFLRLYLQHLKQLGIEDQIKMASCTATNVFFLLLILDYSFIA